MLSRFYKMGNFEEICNTGLSLGLGMNDRLQSHHRHQQHKSSSLPFDHLFPSLTLGLSSSQHTYHQTPLKPDATTKPPSDSTPLHRQTSSLSAVSSYYSNSSVKKEASGDEVEEDKITMSSSKASTDDQEEEGSARKKLRLSKQQSYLLEESFKDHSTLNPKQKQALAKQLNLRPRQVEVWFQNRRARTKLKQTEVDCELLKKCCEALAEENRRLQKEVQELKALKLTASAPLYMQLPAATLTVCPSCERITAAGSENSSKTPFPIGTKQQQQFYNPLTHPSAAC